MQSSNTRKAKQIRLRAGFTLVELAVVLIVIGLITAMGMVATIGMVESARLASTYDRMDVIEKALMDFRNKYDRLPCPGDPTLATSNANYGRELRTGVQCQNATSQTFNGSYPPYAIVTTPPYLIMDADSHAYVTEGGVPTKTLGLPDELMFDGWGRRIMYTIPITAGTDYSFRRYILPQDRDCAGSINDSPGLSTVSNGPIYVLYSYGKNGHGGFTSGTTRMSDSSATADELANCHCSASGAFNANVPARWVLPEGIDDIIRYKERWQMQNEEDYNKAANYKDYVLALSYGATQQLYFYKYNTCTRDLWTHPNSTSTLTSGYIEPSGATNGAVVFSVDNTVFFHTNSATVPLQPYSVTRDTITSLNCGGTIYDCIKTVPAGVSSTTSVNAVAVSNNRYVALAYNTVPYVQVYRASDTTTISSTSKPQLLPLFTSAPVTIPAAFSVLPTLGASYGQPTTVFPTSSDIPSAMPTLIAFSKDAKYMYLADKSSYATMYARIGANTYKRLHASLQPSVTAANVRSAAFSPDGKYFAVGSSGAAPEVRMWSVSDTGSLFNATGTSPFTSVTFSSIAAPGLGGLQVAFSPDGKYFVAAGGAGGAGGSFSIPGNQNVYIFRVDLKNTFTNITSNITGSYTTNESPRLTVPIVFTPDSNTFFVATTHTTGGNGGSVVQFTKISDTTWAIRYAITAVGLNKDPAYVTSMTFIQ